MISKLQLLQDYFGHSTFRELQEEIIDTILNNQDILTILPTGGGKSLCYQLPSLMMSGVTVVISPLLALMYDQVVSLNANGIKASMISSGQSLEEIREVERSVIRSEIKLLYVAPERLENRYFISLLHRSRVNFFVVDEAHCLSQWGHEFRESYRKLSILKEQFPHTTITTFTATATNLVQDDIIKTLNMRNAKTIKSSIYRNNIALRVKHRIDNGKLQLLEFLKLHKGESGIVYTLSRKSTESIASFLNSKRIKAKAYHAGLETDERNSIYNEFIEDKIDIVVATIAFGMGIDKADIRFVAHLNLPKNLESYYQEVGRAGRDGEHSETLLLFTTADLVRQRLFIDELKSGLYKQNAYHKLQSISKFATANECRHQIIASYFQESISRCQNMCDNCIEIGINFKDITEASKKILSTIYRTNQNHSASYIVEVLKGSQRREIIENAHDKLSVYNIGDDYSKSQWLTIIDRLLELNALEIDSKRAYKITLIAQDILRGKIEVDIREDRLSIEFKTKYSPVAKLGSINQSILKRLIEVAREIAIENSIPSPRVLSQKSLKEMSQQLPTDKKSMLAISGIGEVKYQRYAKRFIDEIKRIKEEIKA